MSQPGPVVSFSSSNFLESDTFSLPTTSIVFVECDYCHILFRFNSTYKRCCKWSYCINCISFKPNCNETCWKPQDKPCWKQPQEKDISVMTESLTEDCTICLDTLDRKDGTNPLRYLPCAHTFHQKCINTWLTNHSTCPICVRSINEEEPSSSSSSNLVSSNPSLSLSSSSNPSSYFSFLYDIAPQFFPSYIVGPPDLSLGVNFQPTHVPPPPLPHRHRHRPRARRSGLTRITPCKGTVKIKKGVTRPCTFKARPNNEGFCHHHRGRKHSQHSQIIE